jgi:hypothetical protein
MNVPPPPKPRPKRRSTQFIVLIVVAAFGALLAVRAVIISSGITRVPDNLFGDQHLSHAVFARNSTKERICNE